MSEYSAGAGSRRRWGIVMGNLDQTDARYCFLKPLFVDGGIIFGLASREENVRDGLAMGEIGRLFPIPTYENIHLEPGRPTVELAENIILVGSSILFLKSNAYPTKGGPPLSVGQDKLGERLKKIEKECCYGFIMRGDHRAVINKVTKEVYRSQRNRRRDIEIDFAVIRRKLRCSSQNTVIVEGLRRLGTIGAAKVLISSIHMGSIEKALSKIKSFDESALLEILVKVTFHPRGNDGVYSFSTVEAVPLMIVYNHQWTYDLIDGHQWIDQHPWDIHLVVSGDDKPIAVPPGATESPVPRLEIQGDLRTLGPGVSALCRRVFATGTGSEEDVTRLLEVLTAQAERFHIELVDETPWNNNLKIVDLPIGRTAIRRVRMQFLVLLALCRALGRGFYCDDSSIRQFLPKYEPGSSAKSLTGQFIAAVPCRLREGFEPLLGPARKPKGYLQVDYSKKTKTYNLRLDRIVLVIKLRL